MTWAEAITGRGFKVEKAPPKVRPYVPKDSALLCLDCEAVYESDGGACPACASNESMPLARVTERGGR